MPTNLQSFFFSPNIYARKKNIPSQQVDKRVKPVGIFVRPSTVSKPYHLPINTLSSPAVLQSKAGDDRVLIGRL